MVVCWGHRRTGIAVGLLLVTLAAGCVSDSPRPIVPPALRPGDTIMFVAPAGKLDPARMERARQRLEGLGFKVRVPDDLYRARGYLAGPDDVRAAELMAAFRDPNVAAIFPGTGNYGCTRILDLLDYDVIRANPKVLIGFSDLTALHLAIQRKTGLVTFHSPNPMYGLGNEGNLSEFSGKYFWRALRADQNCDADGRPLAEGYTYEPPADAPQVRVLSPGVARGRLTGGNLSLVAALMGTPYEIETAGRILFLEDVDERPYRIDRFLSQLKLAGKLQAAAGVVLGQFPGCVPNEGDASLTLDEVFADYFAELGVPVIADFPAGHAKLNATLPMNAIVEVDADAGSLRVLGPPVTLP